MVRGLRHSLRRLLITALVLLTFISLSQTQQIEVEASTSDDLLQYVSDIVTTGFDGARPSLRSRASSDALALSNNDPQNMNISPGETNYWMVSSQVINGPHGEIGPGLPGQSNYSVMHEIAHRELRKRQNDDTTNIFVTINTCLQPVADGGNGSAPPPHQLQLYYSTSSSNTNPGPDTQNSSTQVNVTGGYGLISLPATSSDLYVGVAAVASGVTSGGNYSGIYNYEIAFSNDAPYHNVANSTSLYFIDGDDHAALLATSALTNITNSSSPVYQQWMNMTTPPFNLFAFPTTNTSLNGLQRSYCGLRTNTRINANVPGIENQNTAILTTRFLAGSSAPKQQFYINALTKDTSYTGFLALTGNSTASGNGVVGGGGTVFTPIQFNTKADDNCALMYNLSFCDSVAYAVPSNPYKFSPVTGLSALGDVYDNYAKSYYAYFGYALQQIPCNTTAVAQYSLARTCTDCANHYKDWLCAVTIPRCEDWSNDAPYLQPRNMAQNFTNGTIPPWVTLAATNGTGTVDNMTAIQANDTLNSAATNQSRNSIIDTTIQPGPYKEVLPCIDLCFNLVQSCPAALGFGCPMNSLRSSSYGQKSNDTAVLSCSYPGAAHYLSQAQMQNGLGWGKKVFVGVTVAFVSWVI